MSIFLEDITASLEISKMTENENLKARVFSIHYLNNPST